MKSSPGRPWKNWGLGTLGEPPGLLKFGTDQQLFELIYIKYEVLCSYFGYFEHCVRTQIVPCCSYYELKIFVYYIVTLITGYNVCVLSDYYFTGNTKIFRAA